MIVDDNFVAHYGPAPHILTAESTRAVDDNAWDATRLGMSGYGSVVQMVPKGAAVDIPKNRVSLFTVGNRLITRLPQAYLPHCKVLNHLPTPHSPISASTKTSTFTPWMAKPTEPK